MAERLEALELRKSHSIQITAEKGLGDKMIDVSRKLITVVKKTVWFYYRHSTF